MKQQVKLVPDYKKVDILAIDRGAGVFFARGKNLKKGTFFVEKALRTKANSGSHAAI